MPDVATISTNQAKTASVGLSLSSGETALRLTFLDGIRALAALYVVLSHHVLDLYTKLGQGLKLATFGFQFGHYAVDVFIVLSGYCLMLPVARSGRDCLRGGTIEYLSARALRILPPYFAALFLSLGVLAALGQIGNVKLGALIAHLLVIHNFSPNWVWSINPPLWSVAVEWQIYFTFPLLLLPLRKLIGTLPTVGVAWLMGMIPHLLLPKSSNLDWSYPWYLGLFAMGIWAAEETYRNSSASQKTIRMMGAWLSIACYAFVFLMTIQAGSLYKHPYAIDFFMGCATALGLAWAGRHCLQSNHKPWVVRCLSWRWLVALGTMSFSLYLIHLPAWWLMEPIVQHLNLQPASELAFRLLIGTPISVLIGLIFYLTVEKPSMLMRARAMSAHRKVLPVPDVTHLAPSIAAAQVG